MLVLAAATSASAPPAPAPSLSLIHVDFVNVMNLLFKVNEVLGGRCEYDLNLDLTPATAIL